MNDRKVKGKPVIYTPVGETFVGKDGETYKAVADSKSECPCLECDFPAGKGMCGSYRCVRDDRADGVGVHFVMVRD